MSDLATRTAAPLVIATSRKLGVDLPKPLAASFAEADKLRSRDVVEALDVSITKAVADAVLAGRDVLASKDVQRAALALTLSELNLEGRLREHSQQLAARALVTHADAVIDTWRPTVERVREAFARFRAMVPDVDPLDPGLPNGLPTNALTPWGEAKEAAAQLEQLVKGWQAIASAGAVYMPHNTLPLVVADLSYEQLRSMGDRARPQDVARFDVPLELASVQTFADRVARITEERTDRQAYDAAAPERAREERRQKFGYVRIPGGAR